MGSLMLWVRSRFEMIAILLLLTIFLLPSVSASPGTHTLTSSTGEVELNEGVKVKISYRSQATVSHPSTIGKGKTESWSIELEGGTIDISVYVPYSGWYSESMSIPIGSYIDIPIETGISMRVKVVSSASLRLTGDARLSTYSLHWSSEGTKTFNVTTYDDASGKITVESNFNFQINLGLVIGISLFSIEIINRNIGTFPASPKISESMTVPSGGVPLSALAAYAFLVVVVVILIAVAFTTRRAKPSIQVPKPPRQPEPIKEVSEPKKIVSKPEEMIYCVYCGEKLPSHAVYCRKCGKKVE